LKAKTIEWREIRLTAGMKIVSFEAKIMLFLNTKGFSGLSGVMITASVAP